MLQVRELEVPIEMNEVLESITITLDKFGFKVTGIGSRKELYFEDTYRFGISGKVSLNGSVCIIDCAGYKSFEINIDEDIESIILQNLHRPLVTGMRSLSEGLISLLHPTDKSDTSHTYFVFNNYVPGVDVVVLKDLINITGGGVMSSMRLDNINDYDFKTISKCYRWVNSTVDILFNV